MRHDWAQYYDKVEDMDGQVGALLKELEEEGLAENTIVFYYTDHGGVLGRSKRYLYETGTHVPMIVRIPEKYKHLYPARGPGFESGPAGQFCGPGSHPAEPDWNGGPGIICRELPSWENTRRRNPNMYTCSGTAWTNATT